jgi:uncharacterized membrane protein YfcA
MVMGRRSRKSARLRRKAMTSAQISLLVGSSVAAGVINAVAGGGSFFTFPALIFSGLPSIQANATSTMALWPGTMASVTAYRDDIRRERRLLPRLMAMSVVGGLIGAIILVHTPQATFDWLLPWLLLIATLSFAFGGKLSEWLRRRNRAAREGARIDIASCAVQFVIAVYAGYFGGGASMLMLAMLSLAGMTEIHPMNGIKTLLSGTQNLIALGVFIHRGIIFWPQALLMMGGAVAGGYGGAFWARTADPRLVRGIVIGVGIAMTGYFFVRG